MGVKQHRPQRTPPALSDNLRIARATLDTLDGVDVIGEWEWDEAGWQWVLTCRLTIDNAGSTAVPRRTDWAVLVDPAYPWGEINFQPRVENSLEATFPHQLLNRAINGNHKWRSGRLCVDPGLRRLGRQGIDPEPYEADQRLAWLLARAVTWLEQAARGELTKAGDDFELPDFGPLGSDLIAFSESENTFSLWESVKDTIGTVELLDIVPSPAASVVEVFRAANGARLYAPKWGSGLSSARRQKAGLWLKIGAVPTVKPWQAPTTWGELRAALKKQSIDLDALLNSQLWRVRDGEWHVLLIGFPIPKVVGGPPSIYHWQPLRLPAIAPAADLVPGFRPGRAPSPSITRLWDFRDEAELVWMVSENWNESTVSARGRFNAVLATANIFVIGAGALGAAISEMLIRGGVQYLTLCDSDRTHAGNLVRHTLLLSDLNERKAVGLARRLNQASPHANVHAISENFPPISSEGASKVRSADIIIDCTGENSVAVAMSELEPSIDRFFFSASLGLNAQRAFLFSAYGLTFPLNEFFERITEALSSQRQAAEETAWPREGIGCWHPLFPARDDFVWTMAALMVTAIAEVLDTDKTLPWFITYQYENGEVTRTASAAN